LTAAKELGRFGIRVNALAPSAETDMTSGIPDDRRQELEATTPLGRLMDLDATVEAALFLAGQRSSHTTGQVLNVDGGLHLH
jgi:3-oxoacyl-[acyl-carrier protein] reductase